MKPKHFWSLCLFFLCGTLQARDFAFTPDQVPQIRELLGSNTLLPGDRVILEDGTYTGWDRFEFCGSGTTEAPILFTARNPGKAVISGAISLRVYGEYLTIDGLLFRKAWAVGNDMISFRKEEGVCASHCRLTNSVFDDCNDPEKGRDKSEYWVGLFGKQNRVDHCYFTGKTVGGLVIQVWLYGDSYENEHRIDHNFFGERLPFGGNGAEIIRIGHSWSSQHSSKTMVEDNVFYHCDGENETISVKSGDNVVRRNLFYETRGGITLRHGHNNVIESNVFIGNNIPGTMGIRIINQGHQVYNNYMQEITGTGSSAALVVRMGVYEKPTPETDIQAEPLTSYHRVTDVDIAFNTFIRCAQLDFGQGAGDKEPLRVRMANNLIYNPAVDTDIQISNPAVFPGLHCYSNYVYYKPGSEFSLQGFIPAPLKIEKRYAGSLKGIYRLEFASGIEAVRDFDDIRNDATGMPLREPVNAGAVQFANRDKPFSAVKPAACGVNWYAPLQTVIKEIATKTAFE